MGRDPSIGWLTPGAEHFMPLSPTKMLYSRVGTKVPTRGFQVSKDVVQADISFNLIVQGPVAGLDESMARSSNKHLMIRYVFLRGGGTYMATFSQRMGFKPLQKAIQNESLDQDLRNRLWSMAQLTVFRNWEERGLYGNRDARADSLELLYKRIWVNLFKLPIDSVPSFNPDYPESAYKQLRKAILSGQWADVLDLLEYVAYNVPDSWAEELRTQCNIVFEEENSGYRFVAGEITPITDQAEIESIETAASIKQQVIRNHLGRSLQLLSAKKSPDYRNAMKEAISAVESACKVIASKPNASLGDCLKVIKNSRTLHPALEKALGALYGYTSESGGIRHALSEETEHPTYADARFLLVSCTAFINYLWTIAAESRIDLNK